MEFRKLTAYDGAPGFILDWMIAGFFPSGTVCDHEPDLFDPKCSRHWKRDWLAPLGGAAAIRGRPAPRGLCAVEWLPIRADDAQPKVRLPNLLRAYPELARAFPGERGWDHQWYALALLTSDTAQDAELRLCGQDGCQVWWNGAFVLEEHAWHKLAYDLYVVPVRLRRGRNTLLLKLDRHGLLARITTTGGGRLRGAVCALAAAPARAEPAGTFEQLRRQARTLRVTLPCRARPPAAFTRWHRAARAHLHACLRPFPALPAHWSKSVLVERTACDGHTRFRYHLPREAGSMLPVYVLVPEPGRANGRTVICPHGHGQDDQVVAGVAPPAKPYNNWCGPFTGNYAELLARAGFVTATWSERALSHERQDSLSAEDPCATASLVAQAMGLTLPGLHVFDLHGVADFVATLPGVDPARMGLTGLSGGGTLAYLGGAYDDRFKAVAVFCGLLGYEDYLFGDGGCGQQVVPGLYPTLDVGEVLGLIAPRPLLVAQGRRDMIFNVFRAARFASDARRAYRARGCPERVETHFYDLAHQVDIDAARDFFLRRL